MKKPTPYYYIGSGALTKMFTLRYVEWEHRGLNTHEQHYYICNLSTHWDCALAKAKQRSRLDGIPLSAREFSLDDIVRRNADEMLEERKHRAAEKNFNSGFRDWHTMRNRAWGYNRDSRWLEVSEGATNYRPASEDWRGRWKADYLGVWYFHFGKHQGRHVREVVEIDRGYCEWLVSELHLASSDLQTHQVLTVQLVETLLEKNPAPVHNSTHQGEVGKMLDVVGRVEVVRTVGHDSPWGTADLIKIRDDQGNLFVTFYRGQDDLEEHDMVKVRAKVRDHEEYDGEDQTTLTRCRFSILQP